MRLVKVLLHWITSNRVMLVNTGSLVGTTAVTSVLGFIYWWVAARQFPLEAVGIASATISAMALLGSFCMLGLGTLLITELPRQPGQEGPLISTALVVVGGVGGGTGILFAIISPYVSTQFNPLKAGITDIAVFASGVGLTAITLVLDQALIGILHGNLQFWRNTFFALTKLLLLFALGLFLSQKVGMTIYVTWVLGMALSLTALLGFVVCKRGWHERVWWPQWRLLHKLGRVALEHHFLNLTLQAPTLILPVLVTVLLSAKVNAWFYVSWMIANFVFVVPSSLTTVLHAMSSAQQSALRYRARITLGLAFGTSLLANGVLQLATKQVLATFGSVYAEQAAWCLRILLFAAFPLIIKNHYISFCRIQDRVTNAMLGILPGGILELAAAAAGAHLGGLSGLSLGWVIGITVEALCMFPTVYKTVQGGKGTVQVTTQELAREAEAIWLLDTLSLTAIANSLVRVPTVTHSELRALEHVQSIQHKGSNADHAKPRLRPIRLEHYLTYDEYMSTTNTEQTIACPDETPRRKIMVSRRISHT
jgi:O-antigen/teichoic acid export membrane protein